MQGERTNVDCAFYVWCIIYSPVFMSFVKEWKRVAWEIYAEINVYLCVDLAMFDIRIVVTAFPFNVVKIINVAVYHCEENYRLDVTRTFPCVPEARDRLTNRLVMFDVIFVCRGCDAHVYLMSKRHAADHMEKQHCAYVEMGSAIWSVLGSMSWSLGFRDGQCWL